MTNFITLPLIVELKGGDQSFDQCHGKVLTLIKYEENYFLHNRLKNVHKYFPRRWIDSNFP